VNRVSDTHQNGTEADRLRLDEQAADQSAELQALKEALESANKARDKLLARLSHDLRSPLAILLLWTNLLKDGNLTEEQKPMAIATILQSANDLSQLINGLLDASRADTH
jgi:signal transduction histidine kinase